jgi:hypothetical protein
LTKETEVIIIQSLIRLYAQIDIHTDKDRELISKLYKLLKEMETT